MLLHGDSKHDDVQAFFLLPLLTFILSYLPKYMIGSAQICSGIRWLLMDCNGELTDQISLLETNYFPRGKVSL